MQCGVMATTGENTPTYRPVIHQSAERELTDVPSDTRDGLVSIIKAAAEMPEPSGHSECAPLQGHPLFRVRCGKYRALCALEKPELRVLLVGHREGIYDRMDEAASRM